MQANRTKSFTLATTCALAVVASAVARAQDVPVEVDRPTNLIGLAVVNTPDYIGSDDYKVKGAPLFRYQFAGSNRYFSLVGAQAKLNLIDSKEWRAGPTLNYNPGRKSGEIDDDQVKQMKSIGSTTELGVFGEYWMFDSANPRNRGNIGLTVLNDSGDGSSGMLYRLSGLALLQVHPEVDLLLGASIQYANSDYMQTYFGVNADNVGTSGLSFHDASAGLENVALTAGGLWYIDKSWMALGVVRYTQLQGDAGDSPIVNDRGDKNQWLAGVGFAYMW